MFGMNSYLMVRAICYMQRVNRNVQLRRSTWSKSLARNWSQFQPCHFGNYHCKTCVTTKRWFKLCCCLSDKNESIRHGNKIISEWINSRITVGIDENIQKITNDSLPHQGVVPHTDFLGIEVFPEIFDQLPPKCTGCGAILQSQNENKPGFIPENRNPNLSRNSDNSFMPEIICTRCFSLKHYNKDVLPMVLPETISKYLTHISRRKALMLYVIDLMDIPGSYVEDLLKIVGETKHIILVCNKIDRLPVDGHPTRQIQHVKRVLWDEAMKFGLQNANVHEISVISAKTGFGILDLVKIINKHWRKNSDMYLVGSNNSGKTTLFNLLVDLFTASRQSDNMLQRGTVSPTPGTTLSLLRYPITQHRFMRLQERLKSGYSEKRDKENLRVVDVSDEIIDKQMTKYRDAKESVQNVDTAVSPYRLQFVTRQQDHQDDNLSWLCDTPGLYNRNQITHLLTNQETKLLNPTLWFVPRTVILRPGNVVFLGGLARLDFLNVKRMSRADSGKEEEVPKASQSIFFTVFASPNVPIHVTSLERADELYQQHAGNELLKVPSGGRTRMEEFPELTGRVLKLVGLDWKRSAADVILSSIGWIAVTAGSGSVVSLKAYTPNGAGLYLREPALLPTSVRQRGRRGVPYLGYVNHYMYQGTRKRSPALTKYFTEQNLGTTQWMKIAEQKRKQQRALLKFNKTRYHSKLRIGFSARSNPTRYLPDYDIEKIGLEGKARTIQQIEGATTGRVE